MLMPLFILIMLIVDFNHFLLKYKQNITGATDASFAKMLK